MGRLISKPDHKKTQLPSQRRHPKLQGAAQPESEGEYWGSANDSSRRANKGFANNKNLFFSEPRQERGFCWPEPK